MKHTILLVDDEPHVLTALSRVLSDQPFQIETAHSGEEAKHILQSRPIDLLVSDEQMDGMPGSELMAWVAGQLPEVVRIILTGHASVPAAVRAINEGRVYRFFTKPVDPLELAITIRIALEEKEKLQLERKVLEATERMFQVGEHVS